MVTEPIVLLSRARSGSWALGVAFEVSPRYQLAGEVLNPAIRPDRYLGRHLQVYDPAGMADVTLSFAAEMAATDGRIPLLMIYYDDVLLGGRVPDLVGGLAERGIRFLHLLRRNRVRQYVSLRIARETRRYRAKRTTDVAMHRVAVDPADLLDFHIRAQREETEYQALIEAAPHRVLIYEDLFDQTGHYAQDTIQTLRSFLPDVGKLRKRPWMHRQNPYPLSEIILNFTEVEQALRGTPLSSMCTDA